MTTQLCALRAEELSKRYRIGLRERRPETLASAVGSWLRAPLVNLQNLRRLTRFDEDDFGEDVLWALRDVSFEIGVGEVVGIIGRNGAGKSTLLRILSRITEPTSGQAAIRGRVASLLEVGTGFHGELSGRENVYLNGTILGMSKAEVDRKFDQIVAFAEVERFIDTPVKRYSSGMKVRLAFSVAAHLEPEVLLVDEVLAVGDVAFQKKCLGIMSDVALRGRTVLFVSHQLSAVRRLCPRTILLEGGTLVFDGDTEEAIGRYLADVGSETEAAIDLPPNAEGALGRGLRLVVLDDDARPRSVFRLAEPIRLVLDFEIIRAAPSVIAAVGILTASSTPIVTFWSEPRDLSPGRYRIEVEVDIRLGAGVHQFAIGLSSEEQAFYRQPAVGTLTISDAATGNQPVRASGAGLVISGLRPEILPVEVPAESVV